VRENKGSPNKVVYKVNKTTGKLIYTKESNASESYASEDYTTDLSIIDHFRIANFELATNYVNVFKNNVCAALKHSGHSTRSFFRLLNSRGLKTNRENFLYKELKFYPTILFICTFARCLGLQTHQLLDPSLPDKLATGEVVVKIQFLPPKDGDK
jgi:hypothetical protein